MSVGEDRRTRDLARRLSEAEATIEALLSGQIDAVVDSRSHTPILLARAQQALRVSEDRLRHERDRAEQYLDAVEVILLAVDLDGVITLVNRHACMVLGWSEPELLGRDWVETCHPLRMWDALRTHHHHVVGGDLAVVENPVLTKAGEERLIEWRNTLLRDGQGRVIGRLSCGTDITERHQAAEALRTAEERVRFALEAAGVGIWDLECSTGLVRWSETLEAQYGLQPGTFDGTLQAFIDRIYADDRESVLETVGKAMKSGADFSVLNRSVWPDGTVRWLGGAGRFLFGEDGEPLRGVGVSQDVTERRHAETALRTSTADLVARTHTLEQQATVLSEQAALLDLAQDAVIVRDMHGRIVFWSRGAEVMYGWPSADAVGQIARDLLKTEFFEPTEKIEAEFLRQGRWEGEAITYTRDGAPLIVASHWVLQRNAEGTPHRILTINSDITDRKQAESELRLLTKRLSLATAVARLGVWQWDLASNALTWDATMCEIYGFPPTVAIPYARWATAVHPEDLAEVEAILHNTIKNKGQASAEFRITRTDGAVRRVLAVERVMLDEHAKVSCVIGVNMDITERKAAEADLRAAKDAAEAANRAKSEFLANMSHEIRTPMNGVIGMTNLVLASELTSEQRENLGIVKSSADALLTIINDILDFSRIEAGKLALDPMAFSPRDATGDAAHAVAFRAHQKGLELIVDIDGAVPPTLRGDPGRLRQILVNLLGNAVKFTTEGEIVLRVTTEDAPPAHDVALHFSVRDTGVGIPAPLQERVFEAFTQADSSTTRLYGGTGLGLTIASQLVKLMGGRLWVESEPGRGSTFHFTAMFAAVDTPAEGAVRDAVDLQRRSVLIVDDNATNRRVMEEMVSGWGMVPTLAADASEALRALRAAQATGKPLPLVVTDFLMPDGDGFTLAGVIKNDPAIAATIVVMLTSIGQVGDAARCREVGISAYLPKPVRRSELRSAITLALSVRSGETDRPPLVTRHSLREARPIGRILLVEDNRVNQLLASRLLEKRGHTVVCAINGREALAILEAAAWVGFDCVLMDVQMPVMNGLECAAIIRDRERGTRFRLPIIAMTAHAMKEDEARCLAAGMDAYLSKPIHPDALFELVERYLVIASSQKELAPTRGL